MNADELLARLGDAYDDVVLVEAWGERGLFYNPNRALARGTYFVTVKDHDGPNDAASDLDRDGVYRVNLGVDEATYRKLFGDPPARPTKGESVDTGHDFTRLDELLPHPVYAWAGWVCVLSPSERTLVDLGPLVDEAYERSMATFEGRVR